MRLCVGSVGFVGVSVKSFCRPRIFCVLVFAVWYCCSWHFPLNKIHSFKTPFPAESAADAPAGEKKKRKKRNRNRDSY